jgi:hypothetical protein
VRVPFTQRPAANAANEGVALHLRPSIKTSLKQQWLRFTVHRTVVGDERCVTPADRAEPARYWLRTRKAHSLLSELILYWLTCPISTAYVERAFSSMTIMDSLTGATAWWRRPSASSSCCDCTACGSRSA